MIAHVPLDSLDLLELQECIDLSVRGLKQIQYLVFNINLEVSHALN